MDPLEQEVPTTVPVDGSPEGTGSQATEPSAQAPEQPQPTGSTPVEGAEQSHSSQPSERPRASEFYKIRSLEKQIREMKDAMGRLGSTPQPTQKTSDTGAPPLNKEQMLKEYFEDPTGWTEKMLSRQLAELKKELLDKELPEVVNRQRQSEELKRTEQESLELLFPKDHSSPDEKLEDRVRRNPAKAKRLYEIMVENKLDVLSQTNPLSAAKITKMLYESELSTQKKPNPAAPKKGQMFSTATGTPPNGVGNTTPNLGALNQEMAKIERALENDGSLRYDDTFMAKRQTLKDARDKALRELAGGRGQ